MERPVNTFDVRGYTVNIYQDTDAQSPDEWGNEDLFLAYDCRRVGAGRKGYARDGARHTDAYHVFALDVNDGPYTILSLGDAVPPRDEDTDEYEEHKGYVYVSREEWPDEGDARKAAESLIEEWNQYLSGDVYGYVIEDDEGEQVESCWGFYGLDACEEEARAVCASMAGKRDDERAADTDAGNLPRTPGEPAEDDDSAAD